MINQTDKDNGLLRGVNFVDCAVHGWLGSPALLYGASASGRTSAYQYGGGIHFYRAGGQVGTTLKAVEARRCSVTGFNIGYYSHGNDATDEHRRVDLVDCIATQCATAVQGGQTTNGWHINRLNAVNCPNFVICETYTTVSNSLWYSGVTSGFAFGAWMYSGAELVFENCALVFDGDIGAHLRYLFRNSSGSVSKSTLRFINCTIVNGREGTVGVGHEWLNIDLVLENTILGNLSAANPYFQSIVATNSQFSLGSLTMAQIRAAWPNVAANCLEASANAAVFENDTQTAPYDVTLDPSCAVAIAGMGCDVSLLPT
jgi:hypothetical protein